MNFFGWKATTRDDAYDIGLKVAEYVLSVLRTGGTRGVAIERFLSELSDCCPVVIDDETQYESFFNGAKYIWEKERQRSRDEAERELKRKRSASKAMSVASKIFHSEE